MLDGSIECDVRIRIFWPAPNGSRPLEAEQEAYAALAEADFTVYSEELCVWLHALHVSKDEFAAFCEVSPYPLPRFGSDGRPC